MWKKSWGYLSGLAKDSHIATIIGLCGASEPWSYPIMHICLLSSLMFPLSHILPQHVIPPQFVLCTAYTHRSCPGLCLLLQLLFHFFSLHLNSAFLRVQLLLSFLLTELSQIFCCIPFSQLQLGCFKNKTPNHVFILILILGTLSKFCPILFCEILHCSRAFSSNLLCSASLWCIFHYF